VVIKNFQFNTSSIFRFCELVESYTFSLISIIKKHLKAKELSELGEGDTYPCLIPDSTRAKGNKGNRCWECMPCSYWNLISYFNQKTIDALVKCTRVSFDYLRKRMQPVSRYSVESDTNTRGPFFYANIVLEIPQISMKPSIDDIQQILNKCVSIMLKMTQNVYEWKHHKLLHQLSNPVADENSKGECTKLRGQTCPRAWVLCTYVPTNALTHASMRARLPT